MPRVNNALRVEFPRCSRNIASLGEIPTSVLSTSEEIVMEARKLKMLLPITENNISIIINLKAFYVTVRFKYPIVDPVEI